MALGYQEMEPGETMTVLVDLDSFDAIVDGFEGCMLCRKFNKDCDGQPDHTSECLVPCG